MSPFWQRNTAVLLARLLKLWLPHLPHAVTLKSLALATSCTYVGYKISTINTGYFNQPSPFKVEAQTTLFKDPVRTAQ